MSPIAILNITNGIWEVASKEEYPTEECNTIHFNLPKRFACAWYTQEIFKFLQKDEQVQVLVKSIIKSNSQNYQQVAALQKHITDNCNRSWEK